MAACQKHSQSPNECFKVVRGIFMADSKFCTEGAGAKNNNCGNVRPGSGKYGDKDVQWESVNNWRKYKTLSDGIHDNVAVYVQLYEGKGLDYLGENWAEGSPTWIANVKHYYNQ